MAILTVLLFIIMATLTKLSSSSCEVEIKGIFSLGDSHSDTGGSFAAFSHGMHAIKRLRFYFPTASSRSCRRSPDRGFLGAADDLGFPFLSSVHFEFRYGANFATMGSPVLVPNSISAPVNPPTTSPLTLNVQLGQFKAFQNRVLHQLQYNNSKPAGEGKYIHTFYLTGSMSVHIH